MLLKFKDVEDNWRLYTATREGEMAEAFCYATAYTCRLHAFYNGSMNAIQSKYVIGKIV